MLVRDIPEHYILLQNSQDIYAVLECIGKLDCLDDCGCLFVEVSDCDYTDVLLCESFTPYHNSFVERIL